MFGNTPRPHRSGRAAVLAGLVLAAGLLAGAAPEAAAQQGQEAIRTYIQRTDELLAWAGDLVRETESAPARRVLGQARDLQGRSRDLLERGRAYEALAVARRARDAMWHSVRLARDAMGLEERLRIRAERFRELHLDLTARARETGNEPAGRFLEQAREQADRAREKAREGDLRLAWNLLDQAGDLMRRAARMLAETAGPERLAAELDRAREAVDRAAAQVPPDAPPHARDLLAQAEESLQRAENARSEGRPGQALQMATLAAGLARRVLAGPPPGPDDEAVRRQLDAFDARAAGLRERVEESGDAAARDRFAQALDQRDRAVTHQRAGEIEQALRRLRAGHDLLNRVADLVE